MSAYMCEQHVMWDADRTAPMAQCRLSPVAQRCYFRVLTTGLLVLLSSSYQIASQGS